MRGVVGAGRGLAASAVELLDRRRRLAVGLTVIPSVLLVLAFLLHVVFMGDLGVRAGVDLRQYLAATADWLGGGPFYHPWQLMGPYEIPRFEYRTDILPVLYPPSALLLLAPFVLVPALVPLWWVIPVGIIALVVVRCRPAPWTWPVLAFCLLSTDTVWLTISGNPVIWVTAALALGTVWDWPAVGVLLKPTLAPFALIGARRRSWWIALAVMIVAAVPFGSLWADYLTAVGNIRGSGWAYSLNNIPMLLVPLVAHLGRRPPARG